MCRKILLLMIIILLLGLVGNSSAALKGWWKFNGNANDSSGNGYNGTVTGASYVTDAIRGTVLEFDGADYVSIPTGAVNVSSTVTIAVWLYGDAAFQPEDNCIFQGTKPNGRVLNAHVPWSDGHIMWDAGYQSGYDRVEKAADSANQYEGQWNHWAFTKDNSTGQMKLYCNGILWHSGTGKTKSMTGITIFKIGSNADGDNNYDGMISDFRVYNTVLSESEILALATTYTISGSVGSLDGVTMSGLPATITTANGGLYTATVGSGWSGTVTPSKAGYTFSPTNKTYSNMTVNQTAQNYTPTLLTYTISGTVGTLDGVTINGLPGNPITSGGGAYTATVDYGWTGTATPSKTGYTFSSTNKTYSNVTANQTAQNYTPTLLTYMITGSVATLSSVTMNGLPGNPVTNGSGVYTATVGYGWNGTATPSKAGYTFVPANMTYSIVTANQTAQNYTPQVTISGTVGTVDDVAMAGLPIETTTSDGGSYTATVNYGWSGTVAPAKEGYSFNPTNKIYSNVTSNQTQNYTPTLITYTVSGYVGTIDGVTMTGLPGNPVTSGGGAFSATVNYVWSGTVTPTKTGYTFSPAYRIYSQVTANLTENYTPIINTYTISGNVGALDGVTINGLPGNPVTSSGGAYSAIVIYGWSGTATPTKDAYYTFTPTTKTYSNVTANQNAQDYTVTTTLVGDVNLVGWWPFNGNADDYSGYGHDGTVTGASYVTSDIGTVLDFDGVDYVSIPSSTFSTIHDQVTIAAWLYGDAAHQPQENCIFQGTENTGGRILNAHVPWSDGHIMWDAGYRTTYDRVEKDATSANQYEGQWNHWAFTKDQSKEQMKVYVNGMLWASGAGKSRSMSGTSTFKIGSNASGSSNYDGMIYDFRIYNRTMSDAEINSLYHASYEATVPSPANEALDVSTSTDLSWTSGYLAGHHDVYFGTDVTAVTNRDQSVFKGSQSGTTYDPGTLANGKVYYWAVDEVNDYYENSPWMSAVWKYTTAGGAITCPVCGGQGLCDLNVQNYNSRLGRISGVQNVNIVQVTMNNKNTVSISTIKSAVNRFSNFCETASFGQLKLRINITKSLHVSGGSSSSIRNQAINYADKLGGNPLITVIMFPTGLFNYNNAGNGHVFLVSISSLDHECGHVLGLAHSGVNTDGQRDDYRDSSSKMSAYPSQNFAVNQQHWLGWPKDHEVVNITDCLNKEPYIEVPLRPVNNGGTISDIPTAYVYEIAGTEARIWIAIPKGMDNNINAIQGGEIFVYQNRSEIGCSGICMNSTRVGRISNPKSFVPHEINGLIIQPISYVGSTEQFEGHNVTRFNQITLRISLANQPPVDDPNDDPNDYSEPNEAPIADWEFSEAANTVLRDAANSGLTGPATWNTNRTGITTTGDDTLNFAPTTNTVNGSVTFFDLAAVGSPITSGKVWTVMEVNDFNFSGTNVGERLRFGMTDTLSYGSITAEFQLRRAANNSIHLIDYAGEALPNTGVEIWSSNMFQGLLEICTEYDFDAHTYEVFYRFNGNGEWTSIGAAPAMYAGRHGNALRLCVGDYATSGGGSWTDTGESFHIGRIYLTAFDPKLEHANESPISWITYPYDGDTFTAGSNISLYALADDTDGNVANVEFYRNGITLIGQGEILVDQPEIALNAGQATIHGTYARYEPYNQNIGYWGDVNDWVSWTTTVLRPMTFEVWVNYSCKNTTPGSVYRVEVGDQIVQGTVTSTGSDWSTYNSICLGTVDIAQSGQIAVNVIPEIVASGGAIMNLRNVTLIPINSDEAYQYVWSNVPAGTYTLTANAKDDDEAETMSDPIVIHVQ